MCHQVRDILDGHVVHEEEEVAVGDITGEPVCTCNNKERRMRPPTKRGSHHGVGVGSGPVVRMLTTATKRRGRLLKRMRSSQSFRSVLSMDIEYDGYMPNLKISARNTVQITGAQDMNAIGAILHHLVHTYSGKGIVVEHRDFAPGFVGDVVLANVHFRMNMRLHQGFLSNPNETLCHRPFQAARPRERGTRTFHCFLRAIGSRCERVVEING